MDIKQLKNQLLLEGRAEACEVINALQDEIEHLRRRLKSRNGYLKRISDYVIPKQVFTSPEHQTNMIIAELNAKYLECDVIPKEKIFIQFSDFEKIQKKLEEMKKLHLVENDELYMNVNVLEYENKVLEKRLEDVLSRKKD